MNFTEMNAHNHEADTDFVNENNHALSSMSNIQEPHNETMMVSMGQLQNLHGHLHHLHATNASSERQVSEQRAVIGELITCSHNMHSTMLHLNERMTKLEYENIQFKSLLTPKSSFEMDKPPGAPYNDETRKTFCNASAVHYQDQNPAERPIDESILSSTVSSKIKKVKSRKQLRITIPNETVALTLAAGLPTPARTGTGMFTSTFPSTPITPGRIGPIRRSLTSIHKRAIHNLDKIMPPSCVSIPLVPLTDTEIIVFFFQSLSRPIVALRLYARNWGPASIVDVLNDHREIEPAYLRNTCSVKCTTSIKKGKDQFGENWDDAYRSVFKNSDDVKATDLIQLTGSELEHAVDCDLRSLCVGLKKYPRENVDGGVFTRCVKHCEATNEHYTIENVWELAAKLEQDSASKCPSPPLDTKSALITKRSASPPFDLAAREATAEDSK